MERSNYLLCMVGLRSARQRSSLVLSSYLKRIYDPNFYVFFILRMAIESAADDDKKRTCFRWVYYSPYLCPALLTRRIFHLFTLLFGCVAGNVSRWRNSLLLCNCSQLITVPQAWRRWWFHCRNNIFQGTENIPCSVLLNCLKWTNEFHES